MNFDERSVPKVGLKISDKDWVPPKPYRREGAGQPIKRTESADMPPQDKELNQPESFQDIILAKIKSLPEPATKREIADSIYRREFSDKEFKKIDNAVSKLAGKQLIEVAEVVTKGSTRSMKYRPWTGTGENSSLPPTPKRTGLESQVHELLKEIHAPVSADDISERVYGTPFTSRQRKSVLQAFCRLMDKGIVEKIGRKLPGAEEKAMAMPWYYRLVGENEVTEEQQIDDQDHRIADEIYDKVFQIGEKDHDAPAHDAELSARLAVADLAKRVKVLPGDAEYIAAHLRGAAEWMREVDASQTLIDCLERAADHFGGGNG